MLYYRILIDTLRDYSFAGYGNDVSIYTRKITWSQGLMGVYDLIGSPAYLEVTLSNAGGQFSLEDTTALYYGKLRRGTMVRVQLSRNGATWTNKCTLKINQIIPGYSNDGTHTITLKCSDILQEFLAQEYVAPLETNIKANEAINTLHTSRAAIWPYESYYQFIGHTSIGDGRAPFYGPDWVDLEGGETTLPYLGDNLDRGQGVSVQQYIKDAVGAEIFGFYLFNATYELFQFFSRYHAADTAVRWYITSAITDAPRFTYARDLVNDFAFSYFPRAIGAADSVLYSSDNVPIELGGRQTKRMTIKYRDPDNPSATVGALLVNDIVRGVDIITNSAADGSGTNLDTKIDITLIKGTASSELVITNRRRASSTYITTLQVRGTPLTTYNKETVYGYNDNSIFGLGSDETSGNDRKSGSESLFAVSDTDFAQAYADFRVNVFGEPQQVIERLTIPVKENDIATQTQIMETTIGDVINYVDSKTHHNTDYMIVGESHTVEGQSERQHSATYTLRPTNRANMFIVGTSTLDSGNTFTF